LDLEATGTGVPEVLVFGVSASLVSLLVDLVVIEFGEVKPEVLLEGTTTSTITRFEVVLSEGRADLDWRKLERFDGAILSLFNKKCLFDFIEVVLAGPDD
jgi:hypothetical protein